MDAAAGVGAGAAGTPHCAVLPHGAGVPCQCCDRVLHMTACVYGRRLVNLGAHHDVGAATVAVRWDGRCLCGGAC
jgi:hypothetical protein